MAHPRRARRDLALGRDPAPTVSPMRAFAHDVFTYPLPPGHRFPLGKYRLVRQSAETLPGVEIENAPAATASELAGGHEADYLARVESGALTRRETLALGLPWSPELVERARRSVGATLLAAAAALEDGRAANLGGGTHHAFPGSGRGYCVFNDVVCATRALRAARRLRARRRDRPRRAPGRRHERGARGRPRRLHPLGQRLRQLPVPADPGRPRPRPARRHRRRALPRGRREARSRRPSSERGPSSASTSPAPTRSSATGSGGSRVTHARPRRARPARPRLARRRRACRSASRSRAAMPTRSRTRSRST